MVNLMYRGSLKRVYQVGVGTAVGGVGNGNASESKGRACFVATGVVIGVMNGYESKSTPFTVPGRD